MENWVKREAIDREAEEKYEREGEDEDSVS